MIIKRITIAKRTPAFIAFSVPVFCLLLLFVMKNATLVLQVQWKQYHAMADKQKIEQIKKGLLHYFKDRQHLPKMINNQEIDYETYVSYYIPAIYRRDHYNKEFKVTFHDLKYRHPEQKELTMEKDNDIYVICTIHNDDKTIQTRIYESELTLLAPAQSLPDIEVSSIKKESRGGLRRLEREPDLSTVVRMLNERK